MGDVCGEDITQQRARITAIKDGSERGTFGKALHQPIIKRLEGKSIFQRCNRKRDKIQTLSLILRPPRTTRTGVTEHSMCVNRSRG